MAQLRCAQTSEFLAEGTPLQMAELGERFDGRDVTFDDVGEDFSPAAVLKARDDERTGLEAALTDLPAGDEQRARIEALIAERDAEREAARALEHDARARMDAARDRVERRAP